MALSSPAGAPISHRLLSSDMIKSDRGRSVLWAAFLTLVVAGPWLLPGYLFGTDWPGPRRIDFPTGLYSSAPLQLALAATSWAVGGEATGKLLVLGSLFAAAATSYAALPIGGFVPRAASSTIYLVNPFVYGRLHYGQLYLLAAYAVLPWAAVLFRRVLLSPGARSALIAAVAMVLLGILDLHVFVIAGVLAVSLLVTHTVGAADRLAYLKRLAPLGLLALVGTLAASAFWIIPLLGGRGPEGSRLAGIGAGDLKAFAAVPDQHLGLLPNLLGLYGFWAENTDRFTSMKAFVPGWPAILGVLLVLCAIGAFAAFRHRDDHLAPWVAGLLVAGTVALVLEMGVSHPLTVGLVQWLDVHVSPYRGMRDAGKWAALLALVYSQLGGLGAVSVLDGLSKLAPRWARAEWLVSVTTGLLLALPLYYGNGLLYGAHGEIKPSQYPPGWYAAARLLAADGHPGRALFLPWHEYMSYSFIQNQNKVVAPPAPAFFSVPVLVSANPEVAGIAAPTDPDQVAIDGLVAAGGQGHWVAVLTALNIKYVLVAREVDWASFRYLDAQAGLVKVGDFGSIVVYRNNGPSLSATALGRPNTGSA